MPRGTAAPRADRDAESNEALAARGRFSARDDEVDVRAEKLPHDAILVGLARIFRLVQVAAAPQKLSVALLALPLDRSDRRRT